jgi:predicted esterase
MLHEFISTKTFRYTTIGNPKKASKLMIVLHGYGQLVEYFVRKFEGLDEDVFIVAPEGMHRFYLKGSSGRVGASWMTKEAREADIHDNIHWLNGLFELIQKKHSFEKTILLGFSQGGATAARWYENSTIQFDHLVMWASIFPPDLQMNLKSTTVKTGKNIFVLGNDDPFFNSEEQSKVLEFYKTIDFGLIQYKGNHDIDLATLKVLLEDLK